MGIREAIQADRFFAGRVKRYHTWPTLHQQTVAEHCWRVAGIYVELFGMPRAEVLYYCLHHDSGELSSGDMPFMAKDRVPGLRAAMRASEAQGLKVLGIKLPKLTKREQWRVKIADLLEMHEFGKIEVMMGNTLAQPIVDDTLSAAIAIARRHNDLSRLLGIYSTE